MPSDNNEEDTPLHRAARFGIPQLAALYLSSGAAVNAVNSHKETPLLTAAFWAFDQKEQLYSEDHHLVCRILLDRNAGGPCSHVVHRKVILLCRSATNSECSEGIATGQVLGFLSLVCMVTVA